MKLKLNLVPENGTTDLYYDIINGYFSADELSDDEKTQKKINEAIQIIKQIADHLQKNELVY